MNDVLRDPTCPPQLAGFETTMRGTTTRLPEPHAGHITALIMPSDDPYEGAVYDA